MAAQEQERAICGACRRDAWGDKGSGPLHHRDAVRCGITRAPFDGNLSAATRNLLFQTIGMDLRSKGMSNGTKGADEDCTGCKVPLADRHHEENLYCTMNGFCLGLILEN